MNLDPTSLVYNSDYYIIAANKLIRSKQDDLTLLEAKLVRLVVSQVLQSDTDFRTYSCKIGELADFLEIKSEGIYREVEKVCTRLMKKVIKVQKSDNKKRNFQQFHWVSYCEYEDGIITIRLSEELKPYLLGLEELFTRYEYTSILNLPTTNAIRLYELMVSYQNMTVRGNAPSNSELEKHRRDSNDFVFSIENLRSYFNCDKKYPNTGDFIKNVIVPSVNAINEKTLMRLSFDKITEGRRIVAIRITIGKI